MKRICVICGENVIRERFRRPLDRTTCGIICRNKLIATTRKKRDITGERNPNWTGKPKFSNGYVYIYNPTHPRNYRNYVKRADLVLEKKIGRLLKKGEMSHHKNENKADDSPENLELMTRGEHQRYHTMLRKQRGSYINCHKNQKRKNGRFAKSK